MHSIAWMPKTLCLLFFTIRLSLIFPEQSPYKIVPLHEMDSVFRVIDMNGDQSAQDKDHEQDQVEQDRIEGERKVIGKTADTDLIAYVGVIIFLCHLLRLCLQRFHLSDHFACAACDLLADLIIAVARKHAALHLVDGVQDILLAVFRIDVIRLLLGQRAGQIAVKLVFYRLQIGVPASPDGKM